MVVRCIGNAILQRQLSYLNGLKQVRVANKRRSPFKDGRSIRQSLISSKTCIQSAQHHQGSPSPYIWESADRGRSDATSVFDSENWLQ